MIMKQHTISKTLNGNTYNCYAETDGRMQFAYMSVVGSKTEPVLISCDFPDDVSKNKCFVAAGLRKFKKTAGAAVYVKCYTETEKPIWVLFDTCNINDKSFIVKIISMK